MNFVLVFLLVPFSLFYSFKIDAQSLPKGVGTIGIGNREYLGLDTFYDSSGKASTVGSRFDTEFTASAMQSGKAGVDMKKLYENIRKYDSSQGSSQKSIADELNFGSVRGSVHSKLSAKFMGIGYGLTNGITIFGGIPFISGSVDADITVEGKNNALEIKNRLGDAAFDELKTGLDQASQISRATILDKIENQYGYKNIEHWEFTGLGDAIVGAKTGWDYHLPDSQKYSLGLTVQLDLPTGPKNDSDSLTQMPISKGYYEIEVNTDHRITWTFVAVGGELGLGLGLPTTKTIRVPEADESLILANRTTSAQWSPGLDTKVSGYTIFGNAMYRGQYKLGVNEHQADQFSGSIEGNYTGLGARTASREIFHEASFILTTIKSFRQKTSIIPLILTLTAHDTLTATNSTNRRFLELTFVTFFSTPYRKG